jgi:hypothetical protein
MFEKWKLKTKIFEYENWNLYMKFLLLISSFIAMMHLQILT